MTGVEQILKDCLKFEQERNETLSERIMELETENKMLKLRLQHSLDIQRATFHGNS